DLAACLADFRHDIVGGWFTEWAKTGDPDGSCLRIGRDINRARGDLDGRDHGPPGFAYLRDSAVKAIDHPDGAAAGINSYRSRQPANVYGRHVAGLARRACHRPGRVRSD